MGTVFSELKIGPRDLTKVTLGGQVVDFLCASGSSLVSHG